MSAGKHITDYDGSRIDMSHAPLKYGKDDAALKGSVKDAVKKFEDKRMKAKVEYGLLVDDKGNIIEEKRGGKGAVAMYRINWERATVMTHIHPRVAGQLGGSFSKQDLMNLVDFKNIMTMRAVAKEGTYSISKGKSFNASAFRNYIEQKAAEHRSAYNSKCTELNRAYKSGKIDYDSYSKAWDREFNKFLSDNHRALLDGQKKYGYTYTLERRKK